MSLNAAWIDACSVCETCIEIIASPAGPYPDSDTQSMPSRDIMSLLANPRHSVPTSKMEHGSGKQL